VDLAEISGFSAFISNWEHLIFKSQKVDKFLLQAAFNIP
jgi:hypothetical protein